MQARVRACCICCLSLSCFISPKLCQICSPKFKPKASREVGGSNPMATAPAACNAQDGTVAGAAASEHEHNRGHKADTTAAICNRSRSLRRGTAKMGATYTGDRTLTCSSWERSLSHRGRRKPPCNERHATLAIEPRRTTAQHTEASRTTAARWGGGMRNRGGARKPRATPRVCVNAVTRQRKMLEQGCRAAVEESAQRCVVT